MDKPLMIAQMQGKYQHIIIKECGHVMHEDNPDKIAETLDRFAKRNMVRIVTYSSFLSRPLAMDLK